MRHLEYCLTDPRLARRKGREKLGSKREGREQDEFAEAIGQ
jgi:hypothetical protein